MSVYRVLDKLEAYVRESTWLPAGYRIVSEERLMELIEKVRSSLPEEVGRAKIIAQGHDRMIRAAQEKADAIVSEAAGKHEELVDTHEITLRARTTADVVLREAEEKARKIREGADQYAAQVLAEMEARLGNALGAVRKGRESLTRSTQPDAAQPLAEAAAKAKRAAFDQEAAAEESSSLESVKA
jgi:hypothetical protein